MRTPGLLRSFGHVFGSGLANELLDRLFPTPPSWSERFLKGFSESLLAALPYVVERMAPPDPKPAEAAPPPPPPVVPPPCAPPPQRSAEDDDAVQVAISKEWPKETPPPVDVLRMDLASLRKALGECDPRSGAGTTLIGRAVKFIRAADKLGSEGALFKAVGDRRRDDETTVRAAARLLAEADAYIAKQAEQIRGLILDNEFKVNCGEITVDWQQLASRVPAATRAAPLGTVPLVLSDGLWYYRVCGALEPIKWEDAMAILDVINANAVAGRNVGGPVKIDETEMAQNAAGGVA